MSFIRDSGKTWSPWYFLFAHQIAVVCISEPLRMLWIPIKMFQKEICINYWYFDLPHTILRGLILQWNFGRKSTWLDIDKIQFRVQDASAAAACLIRRTFEFEAFCMKIPSPCIASFFKDDSHPFEYSGMWMSFRKIKLLRNTIAQ